MEKSSEGRINPVHRHLESSKPLSAIYLYFLAEDKVALQFLWNIWLLRATKITKAIELKNVILLHTCMSLMLCAHSLYCDMSQLIVLLALGMSQA